MLALDTSTSDSAAPGRPLTAMSIDGRCTVASDGRVLRIVGGAELFDARRAVAAAVLEDAIWIVATEGGAHALYRFDRTGAPLGGACALGALGGGVTISAGRAGVALVDGERGVLVREQAGELAVDRLADRGRDRRILLGARGVLERRGKALVSSKSSAPPLALPADLAAGTIGGGAVVFDGASVLVEVLLREVGTALVYDLRTAALRTRIRLGGARVLAAAERSGLAVLGNTSHIALLDLRAGKCAGERILAAPAIAAAIDAAGERIVCVDAEGRVVEMGRGMSDSSAAIDVPADLDEAMPLATDAGGEPSAPVVVPAPVVVAAPVVVPVSAAPEVVAAPVVVAPVVVAPVAAPSPVRSSHLGALGAVARPALSGDLLETYLEVTRRWIVSLCRTALALAPKVAVRAGLAAPEAEAAADEVIATARAEEGEAMAQFTAWAQRGAPHVEVSQELGLSGTATAVLLVAAAPQIWGELARTYGACTADAARPLVDELLVSHLLEANAEMRAAIGRELDEDAPLVRSGAVSLGKGLRPYAAICVHPAIARRLAGAAPAGDVQEAIEVRALDELVAPRERLDAVLRALATKGRAPARVVLRGRTGAGRRTIAASLAACAGRGVGLVDGDAASADVVRARLRDVALRGDVPCVTIDHGGEPAARARLRAVLDSHAGPLFVRAPFGGELPVAPGYELVELPALSETERRDTWRGMLARRGLEVAIADDLAARFSVGPGAMHRALVAAGEHATAETIVAVLRQQRAARIESVATRVDQLADWNDLVVPPEIDDALRELLARAKHRRTVLEQWGMGRVASTARGLTALFQGGPGTGKTLSAGAIARALGYELWRVDLSKVVSKWIGETEKNLAAVFDAAEDGEIVLLFDEADSLFGKRTDVKSSHDRNANLETNYLLQRLDSFTGIAILTTNFGTAIDPAFRRRLSVQVVFPFPDAGDRERLWRAHLPATLPTAGDLDLAGLAQRYELSGGYIRNAVLRAAYLAAADGRTLADEHLRRAVALEYQRAGQLGDGRLE